MKKATKILCTITAIISIMLSVVFLLQAVFLMFNIAGYKAFFIKLVIEMGLVTDASEVNFQVYMSIFDALVGILLNSYASGIYFKISKSENIVLGYSRVLLNIGILQCFFVISIIPGLMGIILSAIVKKAENEIANRPRQENASEGDVADRITNLKARKEKGEITEEQYKEMLNAIIEQTAVSKVNEQWGYKRESLKDKIVEIKSASKAEDDKKDNE